MSEEVVTYSDLLFQPSSQPQRGQRLETTKRKDHPTPFSSWKYVAVFLWIICLGLLLSVGYLVIELNKKPFHPEGCPRNSSSNTEANKTVWKYPTCSNNWHQYGENCYYFSRNSVPWKECHHYCTNLHSEFLKLNTEEEMNFIIKLSKMQCGLQKEKFSISLYYSNKQLNWVWLDDTKLILNKLQLPGHENANNKCAHIKYGRIIAEDCHSSGYCICKKTIH
ncbi:natural killer cells antigen CD94-like [Bos indicus x Bos taurus]|uniref:natural killer cells antigen CD94-like n=1 Tax=Bos indicus x Bos taurus TaxID=30522 RepID=UPI000F7D09F8|nr:natural killer cells antigen CD94-like [Bos indicus x Bos taurus]XP_027397116.1 natural killer cells antigen CD94-like [Bos indicus x Bos taurus]